MSAGYFWPIARSGLDCSERSERRPVTFPALAIHTRYDGTYRGPDVSSLPEAIPKRVPVWYACCVLCVPPVCGPGPGLRPPVRGTAPRTAPDFLIGRALASLEELRSLPASALSFLRRESGAARLLQSSVRSVCDN
jgi:hypothetical protein